jgi:hypothetical protein
MLKMNHERGVAGKVIEHLNLRSKQRAPIVGT